VRALRVFFDQTAAGGEVNSTIKRCEVWGAEISLSEVGETGPGDRACVAAVAGESGPCALTNGANKRLKTTAIARTFVSLNFDIDFPPRNM
jgi:hypothetical protein